MTKVLDCPVFGGNNPLTGDVIWKHRIQGGSEVIKERLKDMYNWDGSSNVASTVVNLQEGVMAGWQLHLFGKSKGVKIPTSTFFTDQEEGTHIRIQPLDLDSLVFRNMVSEWLNPDDFSWEFRLPSETNPSHYYRMKDADFPQHSLTPLWIRASAQVVPGPKLQIFIGAAPANKITELHGSTEPAFPLIMLEKFTVPFLPFEDADMGFGMGPIPFIIDTRDDAQESEVATNCPDGQEIKIGLAKFLQSSIKPNQRNEVTTWTREHSAGSWIARQPNYTVPEPRPLEGDMDTDHDDNDDEAGWDNIIIFPIICHSKQIADH